LNEASTTAADTEIDLEYYKIRGGFLYLPEFLRISNIVAGEACLFSRFAYYFGFYLLAILLLKNHENQMYFPMLLVIAYVLDIIRVLKDIDTYFKTFLKT